MNKRAKDLKAGDITDDRIVRDVEVASQVTVVGFADGGRVTHTGDDLANVDDVKHDGQRGNLAYFMRTFAGPGSEDRPVIEIDVSDHAKKAANGFNPFIVLRAGNKVIVLNPMDFEDHLSLDAHPFIDGEAVSVGMFGMTVGRRHQLSEDAGLPTSHGWPAVGLATLLLGAQDNAPAEAWAAKVKETGK